VWIVDVATRALRAVTPAEVHVHEYAISPDGRTLALVVSSHPNPMQGWYSAQLYTVSVDGGALKQVCTIANQFGRLRWSPDSGRIAFISGVMSDEGNIAGEVFIVPAAGGDARNITPGIDQSITWIDWRGEGILYCARRIEGTVVSWLDPQTGAARTVAEGEYSVIGVSYTEALSVAGDRFAAVRESYTEPPNIQLGSFRAGGWQRKLVDFAPDPAQFPPLNAENKYWQGRDGMPVHGWVVYPPGYTPGKPYPMVANVHGGPSLSITPRFVNTWVRLFTSLGCVVYLPNPRGSWGRGHAYQAANVGDLGGGDWQDIDAGIDLLVQEGIADPEHLAIAGWSYGGYLVTWAVTQTDRFRCAIAGASITNYESNYGVVLNREWQTTMFGSNVYEDFDLHRSRSPIAFVSRVNTPTLLVHGMEDVVAPPQQATEFYVALRHFGVPAELALYPRSRTAFRSARTSSTCTGAWSAG
ncbi:MAG: prolyl oligopeptidase family serine peptidase, partial [Anaerolineae bacterium]